MPEPIPPGPIRIRPGRPYPLGATWDGAGVNFALFSEHATGVELCLFDPSDPAREQQRVRLIERLAGLLSEALLREFPAREVTVRVRKLTAPIDGIVAVPAVQMKRTR